MAAGRTRAGRERGTFDGDAFTGPLLLEGGQAFLLPDADDVLLKVEFLGVKAQESEPQLPHRLHVGLALRDGLVLHTQDTHGQLLAFATHISTLHSWVITYFLHDASRTHKVVEVITEEGVPAVHHALGDCCSIKDLTTKASVGLY